MPTQAKAASQPVVDSWEDEAEDEAVQEAQSDRSGHDSTVAQQGIGAVSPGNMNTAGVGGERLTAASRDKYKSTASPRPPSPPPNIQAINPPLSSSEPGFGPRTGSGPGPLPRDGLALPGSQRTTRPETVSGPAARMIASALGVRAPPRTPEQRAYDRAVKEKEIRRKDELRERSKRDAEQREQARNDIWDG